jgi:transposase-like protein
MPNPVSFRYFKTSPEIIQLAVMLYVRFPLSLRNVEDLLHERGVDVSYESVWYWWHRFSFKNVLEKLEESSQKLIIDLEFLVRVYITSVY